MKTVNSSRKIFLNIVARMNHVIKGMQFSSALQTQQLSKFCQGFCINKIKMNSPIGFFQITILFSIFRDLMNSIKILSYTVYPEQTKVSFQQLSVCHQTYFCHLCCRLIKAKSFSILVNFGPVLNLNTKGVPKIKLNKKLAQPWWLSSLAR